MKEEYWQSRWQEGQIGFHEPQANRFLVAHFAGLRLPSLAHVFVPLCGKTVDLDWLLSKGHRVTGIEFNRAAIDEVFERLSIVPEVTKVGELTCLTSKQLTIWHGDLFALQTAHLGEIDAVYDRAALVALPSETRQRYARHLLKLAPVAVQLLICFAYDQNQMDGPPFSVTEKMIKDLYPTTHHVTPLGSAAINGPLAARCEGSEQAWQLTPLGH